MHEVPSRQGVAESGVVRDPPWHGFLSEPPTRGGTRVESIQAVDWFPKTAIPKTVVIEKSSGGVEPTRTE
jgi:hypothetical protein